MVYGFCFFFFIKLHLEEVFIKLLVPIPESYLIALSPGYSKKVQLLFFLGVLPCSKIILNSLATFLLTFTASEISLPFILLCIHPRVGHSEEFTVIF